MSKHFNFNRRYNTIAAYAVIIFGVCLLLCVIAFRIEIIQSIFSKILAVSAPILWGMVIAYLLNPLMKFFEKWLGKLINRKKPHRRVVRGLSVALSVILLAGIFVSIIASVIPEIVSNIQNIGEKFQDPQFLNSLELQVRSIFANLSEKTSFLAEPLKLNFDNLESFLLSILDKLEISSNKIFSKDGVFSSFTSGLMNALDTMTNVFLGLIVSVYLLSSKERFQAQGKKFIRAFFNKGQEKKIVDVATRVNHKFIGYFSGVALDCAIIGILTFLFMMLLRMPYALLISVILALTNAIPIFGPYIGSIPSFLLLLLFSPTKAIVFLLFAIILQQIDGNIIAPKILGDQLGLSGFWIMCAVFIGGGLFGIVGMVVASPTFAVIYSICSELTMDRLKDKGEPYETDDYLSLPPLTETPVKQPVKSPELPSDTKQ